MSAGPRIVCIGAVHWDVIGRTHGPMPPGGDLPGRITRRPGGVALNVAAALARHGLRPAILGAVGQDPEGEALVEICGGMGIDTDFLMRSPVHPTDIYMAIETDLGLVAAVADVAGLEAAGRAVFAPLVEGPLGTSESPFTGVVVLDGNLPADILEEIAFDPAFALADLRIAPASPAKADRIAPLIGHPRATVYLNRAEAGLMVGRVFSDAAAAAAALREAGVPRVLVTDGRDPAVFAAEGQRVARHPTPVTLSLVTGAGDALMAAHIASERSGASPEMALRAALAAAARHIGGASVA